VNHGVTGARVIAAFHEQRVLPLMRRVHYLDEMVPDAPFEGTVLMMEELNHEEIKKHIKSALESAPFDTTLTSTRRCVPMMTLSKG
jgi:hypothetical protein